jgi:hypothetical protein
MTFFHLTLSSVAVLMELANQSIESKLLEVYNEMSSFADNTDLEEFEFLFDMRLLI